MVHHKSRLVLQLPGSTVAAAARMITGEKLWQSTDASVVLRGF